jgi:hypothetical protein
MGAAPGDSLKLSPRFFECATDLLHARLLPTICCWVISRVPPAMSFQRHLLDNFWPTCDRLPSSYCHLQILYLLLFFFSPFFACNKARSSLFDLPICILMLCGVFALGPNLWVVDVNDILTFGSRMMSFGLRVLCSQGQRITATYVLNYVCLVQI